MLRDHPSDGDITTREEFDAALERVLTRAVQNGVDPRGSWVYRNGGNPPDWEIIVAELAEEESES